MKRESLVFFLGIGIILMPFLGIPSMWKRIVFVVLGLVLALIGYQLRRLAYIRSIEDHTGERKTDVYVEQVAVVVEPQREPETVLSERDGLSEILHTRPRRGRTKNV